VVLVAEEKTTPTKPEVRVKQENTHNDIFGKEFSLGDSGFEIVYLQELLVTQ
jgi:GTP cyclohydrolase II